MTNQQINQFLGQPFAKQVLITVLVLYAIDYCMPLLYVLLIICLLGSWLKSEENISQ